MSIETGTQVLVLSETTVGAGTTERDGSIESDALLATLWVGSVVSGNLIVEVVTLTDEGKEATLFSFPTISSQSTSLVLKKSGVSLQRFRVRATYTGVCTYEIYVRAISNSGESSSKVLGAAGWSATQATVTTSPALLIASALADRQGLIVKNFNASAGVLYLGESIGAAVSGNGYPLSPGEALAIDLQGGAEIYAVGSQSIDVRIAQAGG